MNDYRIPKLTKNRTIGLLGGSFNPAHSGHLAITLYALKKLKLAEVWWLVSPQNPLKDKTQLAAYAQRLASARDVASASKRIRVLDIEAQKKFRYSYQTIRFLMRKNPGATFAWLMGADNLEQFHRWRRWLEIAQMLPIIVFDRAPYSHTSLRQKTYLRLHQFLLKDNDITRSPPTPSLRFVHLKREPVSSTRLRKTLGKRAFLRHNEGVVKPKTLS